MQRQPIEMEFIGGPLDGQRRMTRGLGYDSSGAIYRPKDGKMVFIGHRQTKERVSSSGKRRSE